MLPAGHGLRTPDLNITCAECVCRLLQKYVTYSYFSTTRRRNKAIEMGEHITKGDLQPKSYYRKHGLFVTESRNRFQFC